MTDGCPERSPHAAGLAGASRILRRMGKTWSPEDSTSLVDDVEQRLFGTLPDDTWVYPGHGEDTTLGARTSEYSVSCGPDR